MERMPSFGAGSTAWGADFLPKPDNDNWRLMPAWRTPAEFMQWVRRRKDRLRRELRDDPRLWSSPEHRLTWTITLAMERCALWHCYGVR